ncbi:MAG: hypothetical protein GY772_20545, partial [bacterium]|nr:hypothetical protein [bacterium]
MAEDREEPGSEGEPGGNLDAAHALVNAWTRGRSSVSASSQDVPRPRAVSLLADAVRLLKRKAAEAGEERSGESMQDVFVAEGAEPARPPKRRRRAVLRSAVQDVTRQYLAARREGLSEGRRGWAMEWARDAHPHLDRRQLQSVLRACRRQARLQGASSQAELGRAARGAGVMGVAKGQVPPARRKRKFGGGRRVKAAAVGEELFAWFVDTISNVKGRIPSSMLLQQAQVIVDDL